MRDIIQLHINDKRKSRVAMGLVVGSWILTTFSHPIKRTFSRTPTRECDTTFKDDVSHEDSFVRSQLLDEYKRVAVYVAY